jgi:hypothetical protein
MQEVQASAAKTQLGDSTKAVVSKNHLYNHGGQIFGRGDDLRAQQAGSSCVMLRDSTCRSSKEG